MISYDLSFCMYIHTKSNAVDLVNISINMHETRYAIVFIMAHSLQPN